MIAFVASIIAASMGGITLLAVLIGAAVLVFGFFTLLSRVCVFFADVVLERYKAVGLFISFLAQVLKSPRLRYVTRQKRALCEACWFEERHKTPNIDRIVDQDVHTCEIGEKTGEMDLRALLQTTEKEKDAAILAKSIKYLTTKTGPVPTQIIRTSRVEMKIPPIWEDDEFDLSDATPIEPMALIPPPVPQEARAHYPTLIGMTRPAPSNDTGGLRIGVKVQPRPVATDFVDALRDVSGRKN